MNNIGGEKYMELLPQARELERHIGDEEWYWKDKKAADDLFYGFEALLLEEHSAGRLTDAGFNSLAAIAFFTYPDFMGDEDDEDLIEAELALEQPISEYHDIGGARMEV